LVSVTAVEGIHRPFDRIGVVGDPRGASAEILTKGRWAGPVALPNLIIIGAMKCGTSSMHNYLDAHPEISMSRQKELNFFSFDRNWQQGESWYDRHFSPTAAIRGESSPSYSKFPRVPHVPGRMKTVIPSARFIYLVRDPVARIVSHYMHVRDGGREERSLDDALSQFDGNPYIDCSRYHMQLQQYLDHFSQSQILVVSAEEMKENRQETLRRVFRFLNVDESFRSPRHDPIYHSSNPQSRLRRRLERNRLADRLRPYVPRSIVYWAATRDSGQRPVKPPSLDSGLREALCDYLREDIQRFRSQVGQEFPQWSI
jgi:Sulfotransferase domain